MKKLPTIIALAISAMTVMAEEFKIGKLTFEITSPTEVRLSDAADDITTVYIDKTIDYQGKMYTVTSIGDYAFGDCSSLTSVTIPNSVTEIGWYAFGDCSSLTSIAIPNSVTSIRWRAFEDCSSLTSVTIPNSVTTIGDYAFRGCSSLTSIAIPNSVTSIGNEAFAGCSSLISLTIPNSVTWIGNGSFSGCEALTKLNYNGMQAQWRQIEKVGSWMEGSSIVLIDCLDAMIVMTEEDDIVELEEDYTEIIVDIAPVEVVEEVEEEEDDIVEFEEDYIEIIVDIAPVEVVEEVEEEEEVVFKVVETMPVFPGGQQAMMKYIADNIQYPVIAMENGIQGRVICQFVLEKDGKPSNIQVVRSSGEPSLDKEAIRVISTMPKWTPGKQRGKPVRVSYTLPVNFRLSDEPKESAKP